MHIQFRKKREQSEMKELPKPKTMNSSTSASTHIQRKSQKMYTHRKEPDKGNTQITVNAHKLFSKKIEQIRNESIQLVHKLGQKAINSSTSNQNHHTHS